MAERTPDRYRMVAGEYYDTTRHPTCAAFRQASALLLAPHLASVPRHPVLEVGAGRSLVAELAPDLANRTIATDLEPTMLRYSIGSGVGLALMSATQLAVRRASVGAVVASLGDPYNTERFWQESARVLVPQGVVLYTTPAFPWSERFRESAAAGPRLAEFLTAGGTEVYLPSTVLDEAGQRRLIEAAGLTVTAVEAVGAAQVPLASMAPKLDAGEPVATLYVAVKP
jgi:SAM-dependent methyltransferase